MSREKGLVEGFMNLDWKRLLDLREAQVLGLDIGSSSVRIVQLRKDDAGYVVTAAGIADVSGGTETDQKHEEINTIRAISKCFQSAGIQTRLAVCGVCGPEVAVRYFKFPLLPPEEIEGAVLLEAAQVCPFNIEDSAVDYQLVPDGEDNVYGVLVAATKRLIEKRRHLAKGASLDCVLMDVDGLALLNCFRECEKAKADRTTAILNVGSSYTTLAIMGANSLPFIRDIAYAGETVVKEIAAERGVSVEAVRKTLFGYENSEEHEIELGDSLEKACQKLIVDVTETLRYYTTQEKSAVVEKIFVCDGFALVRGFVELLDSRLPVRTVLWNPFDKIRCDVDQNCRDILQKNGPEMAVAAGLAMRSI
jgi:type IV pilus assembly protein PilM